VLVQANHQSRVTLHVRKKIINATKGPQNESAKMYNQFVWLTRISWCLALWYNRFASGTLSLGQYYLFRVPESALEGSGKSVHSRRLA
jgi:hypothetical protein